MKFNFLIAFCLLLSTGFASPKNNTGADKTEITISEDNDTYKMVAEFKEEKTLKIQKYMDECLKSSHFSFRNTEADAVITLDDKTTFYMRSAPGRLTLKLDKKKNTAEVCARFKKMCQGVKDIIREK